MQLYQFEENLLSMSVLFTLSTPQQQDQEAIVGCEISA